MWQRSLLPVVCDITSEAPMTSAAASPDKPAAAPSRFRQVSQGFTQKHPHQFIWRRAETCSASGSRKVQLKRLPAQLSLFWCERRQTNKRTKTALKWGSRSGSQQTLVWKKVKLLTVNCSGSDLRWWRSGKPAGCFPDQLLVTPENIIKHLRSINV